MGEPVAPDLFATIVAEREIHKTFHRFLPLHRSPAVRPFPLDRHPGAQTAVARPWSESWRIPGSISPVSCLTTSVTVVSWDIGDMG
ncbi:hypothetical protein, partial [Pseudonocardia zijingensis]|uniref:hypothetical protein n=1 Tax=Pseudonocardia zijingensis TaxID=153376 RepID=UPI0031D2B545